MKLIRIFFGLCLVNSFSYARLNDTSDELEQFIKTKSCAKCDLSNSNLSQKDYSHALLTAADLSLANLNLSNFDFSDFSGALLVKTSLENTSMRASNFDYANFLYAKGDRSWLPGNTSFNGSSFRGANFSHAYLKNFNFSYADLEEARFNDAILDRVIFIGSNITLAQIKQAKSANGAVLANGQIYRPTKD